MYFKQVHIVQCKDSGEFISSPDTGSMYSHLLSEACRFNTISEAIDTAQNELFDNFTICSFYIKHEPVLHKGGEALALPPLCNTGGKE